MNDNDVEIVTDDYYHVFNRGVDGMNITRTNADFMRLLFLILHLQAPEVDFNDMSGAVNLFSKNWQHSMLTDKQERIVAGRAVELVSFTIMPNHLHLCLHQINEGGIARYMQRLLNAHTKFFNTKYERRGHLFGSRYKSVPVTTNEQLTYLSAYIHRNPRDLRGWKDREHEYPWSSYQDYLGKNRWGKLLMPDVVLEQFGSPSDYRKSVEESGAKEDTDFVDFDH